MDLPDLYVGKIVHFVGVSDQVRGRHLPTIVVRNLVASSTRREPSVGYSAEMTPGTWHHIEDCHR